MITVTVSLFPIFCVFTISFFTVLKKEQVRWHKIPKGIRDEMELGRWELKKKKGGKEEVKLTVDLGT